MRKLVDGCGVPIRTLCELCLNAVPNGRDHGCEWSITLQPVPGWDALYSPIKISGQFVDSYKVLSCPRYQREPTRKYYSA